MYVVRESGFRPGSRNRPCSSCTAQSSTCTQSLGPMCWRRACTRRAAPSRPCTHSTASTRERAPPNVSMVVYLGMTRISDGSIEIQSLWLGERTGVNMYVWAGGSIDRSTKRTLGFEAASDVRVGFAASGCEVIEAVQAARDQVSKESPSGLCNVAMSCGEGDSSSDVICTEARKGKCGGETHASKLLALPF